MSAGGCATSALLLLADGRLPAGGHAHSGGLEEAVATGRVSAVDDLAAYLRGRLVTTGAVDSALAAATCASLAAGAGQALELDREALARCPSPALRRAGRTQGRALLRAGQRMWPSASLDELAAACQARPMWPIALGTVAFAGGLDPGDAALVAAHAVVSGPAWAATRLLGLDPFAVARCLADLGPAVNAVAAAGAAATAAPAGSRESLRELPALSAPLAEVGAECHAQWEVRLFAS